ncbi:MAG: HAD family hydrolase, partial [Clostridia bacterium]|nr:HAD family hydrolase [Clostridia bacterium]
MKLFLMDMDGTVYIGDKKIEGAFEALEELRRRGRKVLFLTN